MKKIAIIGGGITGMSTMHYLQRQITAQNLPYELVLIEKNEALGGKMLTEQHGDFIMEVGADSIVARHASVMPLIEELGLQQSVVYNDTGKSYILTNNELHAIPQQSVFGIPTNEEALATSTLLSEESKKIVMRDEQLPGNKFTKDDSIGEFLAYYLGEEIVRKQIAPVLSGVYSGDLFKLTIASTLPFLLDYKNEYGSLMKGFEANKQLYDKNAMKKFISFEGGLVQLFDRLESLLDDATMYKGLSLESIEKQDDRYVLTLDNDKTVVADSIVLTQPHFVAQKLLQDKRLDESFNKLTTASIITVYLGYDIADDVLPKDGTGFIVSSNNDVDCNACTWTSRKWQHTSKESKLLIRMFYKQNNPRFKEFSSMTNEQLVAVAREDVRKSLKIEDEPQIVNISKWMDLMPVYNMEHHQAVKQLEENLAIDFPHVYIGGSSYYGVGIGLCIQNGYDLAERIIESFKEQ